MSDEARQRWSALTDRTLRAAGWFPGRSVSTAEWESVLREHGGFEIHGTARRFLTEFGGLVISQDEPGRTMARAPFRLDPLAAEWDDEIYDVLSEEAGAYLYPIGMLDRRNRYLGMAPNGSVCTGMDDVFFLADTGDEALEKLAEGIQ